MIRGRVSSVYPSLFVPSCSDSCACAFFFLSLLRFFHLASSSHCSRLLPSQNLHTALHPHYAVIHNNKTHALKTRPVSGTTLIEEINKVGFTTESAATIKNGENPYAYIYVFKKKHT